MKIGHWLFLAIILVIGYWLGTRGTFSALTSKLGGGAPAGG